MASAMIGALKVSLGIDSAQFTAGLKASQASLAKFGKTVAVGFAAVATAATAAGAAMGLAVKSAIDNADAMSKAAQKVGVTTEALSRLKYAADFSDVSLEQLTGGLGRLSKTMLDVAGGSTGPAATAFKALGISVTDAAGNLRSSDQVFADIAARFAQMEDGSTKTALAISLFGRAGAELIPLLNSGKDGLAAMAAESDKLGLTISTKTGKAAEQFNDTLTKVGRILDGVANKVMAAALPALQSLADQLASPEFAAAAANFGVAIVEQLSAVIEWLGKVETRWAQFVEFLNTQGRPKVFAVGSTNIENQSTPGALDRQRKAGQMVASSFDALGGADTFGSTADMFKSMSYKPKSFVPIIEGASTAKAAVTDLMEGVDDAQPKVENFAKTIGDTLASAFSGFADAVLSGVPAVEALSDMLGNLGKQLLNSAISGFFGNLFSGGFGGLFGGNKFATASNPFAGTNLLNAGSFAGGGYTGMGSRSGGIDGMGGFPAILHPNETVIDHSMGQTMSGGSSRVLVQMDQGLIGKILQQAHDDAVQVVKTNSPAAVATAQRDKWLG